MGLGEGLLKQLMELGCSGSGPRFHGEDYFGTVLMHIFEAADRV